MIRSNASDVIGKGALPAMGKKKKKKKKARKKKKISRKMGY